MLKNFIFLNEVLGFLDFLMVDNHKIFKIFL